jgi:hypothetical protein
MAPGHHPEVIGVQGMNVLRFSAEQSKSKSKSKTRQTPT